MGNWDPDRKVWHFAVADIEAVVRAIREALPSLPVRAPPPPVLRLVQAPLTDRCASPIPGGQRKRGACFADFGWM